MAIDDLDEATRQSVADALRMPAFDPDALPPAVRASLDSERNSPAAYGARMGTFLSYLIENPVSHLPNYEDTYRRIAPFCRSLSPQASYVIATSLLGPAATIGFDQVPTTASFEFPRDWGPKPRSKVGWHFFVGSGWDADGTEYGIELMLFQSGVLPPALAAGLGLTDTENQVVELQLAISVAGGEHLQADPVVLGGTTGLVEYVEDPFSYRLGANTITCQRAGEFFPITICARGVDRGGAQPRELGVDITFTAGKQYLYQGADGCMPAFDGVGSLYYSIPAMAIDPQSSTITLDGRTIRLARGLFWFDRQWGYLSGVPRSKVMRASMFSHDPEPEGWDWFMAQLTGDRQLTMFAPHSAACSEYYRQTGPTPPDTMSVKVSGTYMDAEGRTALTWGTMTVDDWIRADRSPNPRRYAVTNTWYPNHWRFDFDDVVPEDIRSIAMTPIVTHAQTGFFANGAQYAEGAVVVTDATGRDIGRGFAESTAYADTRDTVHRLAGLPHSPAHVASLSHETISKPLALMNAAYVLAHKSDLEAVLANSVGLEFFAPPTDQGA